jgi:hypothetical protein
MPNKCQKQGEGGSHTGKQHFDDQPNIEGATEGVSDGE